MFNIKFLFALLIAPALLSSCIGLRYLKEDELLLVNQGELKGVSEEMIDEVELLLGQKPNTRLVGNVPIAHLVQVYHFGETHFYHPEKDKLKIEKITTRFDSKISKKKKERIRKKLTSKKNRKIDHLNKRIELGNGFMRAGEKLAVLDTSLHAASTYDISTYYKNHGFFQNTVSYKVNYLTNQTVNVDYTIQSGKRYILDSIRMVCFTPDLGLLFERDSSQSFLKKKDYYLQDNLEKERERLYLLAANNGYFAFSKQYIQFRLDTLQHPTHEIILSVIINNGIDGPHKPYVVDSIMFSVQPSDPNQIADFRFRRYNGVTYRFFKDGYNRKILDWRLFIEKDQLYNRAMTLETQKQLSFLDIFRFVNITYDSTSSDGLTATIFTSPLDKYQTTFEAGFISASQQFLPGPFANIGLKSRNLFGGLELFQIQGNFSLLGIDNVEGNEQGSDPTYSLIQYGGQMTFTLPQFLFPLKSAYKRKIGPYNPKTQILIGYSYEDRLREYERSIANTSLSYLWRVKDNIQFNLSPANLNYTNVTRLTPDFRQFLNTQDSLGNGALSFAFRSAIITSSSFETFINSNQYGSAGKSGSLLRLFGETGGNLTHEVSQKIIDNDTVFSFFKWVKLNSDFRKVYFLNEKTSLALRINIGLAYPYGQTPSLPYDKRFFIGGSNSLRGWQVRRLGPGSFGNLLSDTLSQKFPRVISYQLEQGGDFILETGFEFRKKLVGFIDYAFFADAGNIWIINSNQNSKDLDGDDGKFRFSNFYREIALDVGLGLRFDLSFLVVRFDYAWQAIDPAQPIGERFILDDLNILSVFRSDKKASTKKMEEKTILQNKSNFNVGIGFPF